MLIVKNFPDIYVFAEDDEEFDTDLSKVVDGRKEDIGLEILNSDENPWIRTIDNGVKLKLNPKMKNLGNWVIFFSVYIKTLNKKVYSQFRVHVLL